MTEFRGLAERTLIISSKVLMVIGGAVPYFPQYLQILEQRDATGFSVYVCLVLIIANILRIVYWFGEHFELTLLIQSIVMLVVMFLMLDICVRMSESQEQHTFFQFDPRYFWLYTDILSYIEASVTIAGISSAIFYFFGHNRIVVDVLGFSALAIESCLAFPQLYKNFNNRTTRGMNISMVILWALGDSFKLAYSIMGQTPLPFIMCASVQLIIDFLLFVQVLYYGNAPVTPPP